MSDEQEILLLLELIPTPLLSRKITKPNLLSILETRSNQSLTTSQRQRLFTYLEALNPQGLKSCQIKYRTLTDDIPDIEVDHYYVPFDPEHQEIQERIVWIRSKNTNQSFKFQIIPQNDFVRVEPDRGKIGKYPVQLTFTTQIANGKGFSTVMMLEIENGYRHFFVCKAKVDTKVYDVEELVMDSIMKKSSFKVPKQLVRLRSMFFHVKGYLFPKVFVNQALEWEVETLLSHVQQGTYYVCQEVDTIASCLKLYLSQIVHNPISLLPREFYESETPYESTLNLGSPNNDLILWIVDLMCVLQLNQNENKVGLVQLVSSFVPHLHNTTNVELIQLVIDYFCKMVQERLKTNPSYE